LDIENPWKVAHFKPVWGALVFGLYWQGKKAKAIEPASMPYTGHF